MKFQDNEVSLLIDILIKLIYKDIHQKEQEDLIKHSILKAIIHDNEIGSDEEQPKSEKRKRGRPRKTF